MLKKIIQAIHRARLSLSILVLVLFLALIGLNPINLTEYLSAKFSLAVENMNRATAKVEPNPYNTLAMQLLDKEQGLNDKEKMLREKESQLVSINSGQTKIIYGLAIGIMILFCLILFNYYLDYRRRHKKE